MAVTVVFLPVNTLTISQKEGLSPSNRYELYIHLISLLFYNSIPLKLKVSSASVSTVPHAAVQEVNDLGNPPSEAAIESHSNLLSVNPQTTETLLTNNRSNICVQLPHGDW